MYKFCSLGVGRPNLYAQDVNKLRGVPGPCVGKPVFACVSKKRSRPTCLKKRKRRRSMRGKPDPAGGLCATEGREGGRKRGRERGAGSERGSKAREMQGGGEEMKREEATYRKRMSWKAKMSREREEDE